MEQEQTSQAPEMAAAPSVAGRHALVLSGGGARAAYQVGVLRAVNELLPDRRCNRPSVAGVRKIEAKCPGPFSQP